MQSANTIQVVSVTAFTYELFRCINDGTTRRSCGGTTPYQVTIAPHTYHGEWDIELTGVDLYQGGSFVTSFTMTDPTTCVFKSTALTISGTSSALQFTYSQTGATAPSLCKFRMPRASSSASSAVVSLAFANSPAGTPFMDWVRTLQSSSTDDLTYDLQLSFTATLACDAVLPDIDIVAANAAGNNVAFGYWKGSSCSRYTCGNSVSESRNHHNDLRVPNHSMAVQDLWQAYRVVN
eukprot:PhM_4_TR5551/c0_g2_i1/m.2786